VASRLNGAEHFHQILDRLVAAGYLTMEREGRTSTCTLTLSGEERMIAIILESSTDIRLRHRVVRTDVERKSRLSELARPIHTEFIPDISGQDDDEDDQEEIVRFEE
jgi:hypothetical protein